MTPFRTLDAAALPISQPNFDTDQIIPARYLSRNRDLGLAQCLFHDLRFTADEQERPDFPLNRPGYREAEIVVGAHNFACGSSRENAVWALVRLRFPRRHRAELWRHFTHQLASTRLPSL